MKIHLLLIHWLFAWLVPQTHGNILVQVREVANTKGDIMLAIYADAAHFPQRPEKAFMLAKAKAQKGVVNIQLENVPPGKYAIAVFHDANEDGKINYNMVGIPVEGYGFSNNARKTFGPPSFSQAAFNHRQNTQVVINLRY